MSCDSHCAQMENRHLNHVAACNGRSSCFLLSDDCLWLTPEGFEDVSLVTLNQVRTVFYAPHTARWTRRFAHLSVCRRQGLNFWNSKSTGRRRVLSEQTADSQDPPKANQLSRGSRVHSFGKVGDVRLVVHRQVLAGQLGDVFVVAQL